MAASGGESRRRFVARLLAGGLAVVFAYAIFPVVVAVTTKKIDQDSFLSHLIGKFYPDVVTANVVASNNPVPDSASSESPPAPKPTPIVTPQSQHAIVSSGGVSASVIGISFAQSRIALRVNITNITKDRIYIINAFSDNDQVAILSSGLSLQPNSIGQMTACYSNMSTCLADQNGTTTAKMDYLDPASSRDMSLHYNFSGELPPAVTLATTLSFVIRYAPGNVAGEPTQVRLPLPPVAISH